MQFIMILLQLGALFLLCATLTAVFYNLPNNKLDNGFVQALIRGTQKLRTGSTFEKAMSWGVPVLIAVFFNGLLGVLLLATAIAAWMFSNRYARRIHTTTNPDGGTGDTNVGYYNDDRSRGPGRREEVEPVTPINQR